MEQQPAVTKIDASQLRAGCLIRDDGRIYRVLATEDDADGVVHVRLRAHNGLTVRDCRFPTDTALELIHSTRVRVRFESRETVCLLFSNVMTGEQTAVSPREIGPTAEFLVPGMTVVIEAVDGRFSSLLFPDLIEAEVSTTEPSFRDTGGGVRQKPATLVNSFRVMVPVHVCAGDRIIVHFPTMHYVGTAKAFTGAVSPLEHAPGWCARWQARIERCLRP